MIEFTVVTPVGSLPHHRRWLAECIASVQAQTYQETAWVEHIRVEDDGAGPAATTNRAIAQALKPWIVILNSDDELRPRCLAYLADRLAAIGQPCYLRFPVAVGPGKSSPGGQCFHKSVWEAVGGYPEKEIQFDCKFVDAVLRSGKFRVYDLDGVPAEELYFYRDHPDTWTRQHAGQV